MRKQCVPGSFLSAHALEPGNEAMIRLELTTGMIFSLYENLFMVITRFTNKIHLPVELHPA